MLGRVLKSNADFAHDYVRDQLGQQRITFTPEAGLSDEEKQGACVVENAGESLDAGKEAECYANEYIALHLRETNDDKTPYEVNKRRAGVSPRTPKRAATRVVQ